MKKDIQIGDVDRSGRPLSDRFIHFWNGTTPAEVENIRLKDQVNTLIQSGETVNLILQQLKPVTKFFAEPALDLPASKKRISKKERERLELEEHLRMLETESLDRIKKGK